MHFAVNIRFRKREDDNEEKRGKRVSLYDVGNNITEFRFSVRDNSVVLDYAAETLFIHFFKISIYVMQLHYISGWYWKVHSLFGEYI